jgi:hypothetical protein
MGIPFPEGTDDHEISFIIDLIIDLYRGIIS